MIKSGVLMLCGVAEHEEEVRNIYGYGDDEMCITSIASKSGYSKLGSRFRAKKPMTRGFEACIMN